MGLLSKPIKNLDDLFVHTLRDVYYAEQKITKALPKMISKVSDTQLQEALRGHLEETRGQIKRLEQVFAMHQA
jgi:ferritin-like metal-binding protein YciE